MHIDTPQANHIPGDLVTVSERSRVAAIRREIDWKITEGEIWGAWQKYHLSTLYVPSGELHETRVAQAIQVAKSPSEALHRIEAYHLRSPSSVGADAGEEFRRLYYRTRDAVARREGIIPMSGWIQTVRERRTGV